MIKCTWCQEEAKHTVAGFYHDYGSVMTVEPACDDHCYNYKPYNLDNRGCKTLYGQVITERWPKGLHIYVQKCDGCRQEFWNIELNENWLCVTCKEEKEKTK